MGLLTNTSFALASGMGINAVVVFTIIFGLGLSWQQAMGVIVIEGILVTIMVLTTILVAFRMRGGILLGIIGTAIAGMAFRIIPIPTQFISIPTKESFATFFKADLVGAVWSKGMLNIAALVMVFALFMTDFFDTMGTVIGVGGEAGLLDKNGGLPNLRRVLLIDSLAAVAGGLFGASSITTYIESASGVSDGGRTGIMPTMTGFLFLISIFFAPLIAVVGGGVEIAEGGF